MNSRKSLNSICSALLLTLILLSVVSCKKQAHDEMAGPDEYYTCSMDPQVIENKAGNCPICHMKLIKVKRNNLKPGQLKLSEQQLKLGGIGFDTVKIREVGKEIILTGKIAVDQNLTNAISSKVEGRIENLNVRNVGEFIKKGQLLYNIYSEELAAVQEEFLLSTRNLSLTNNFGNAARNKLLLYGLSEDQIDKIRTTGKIYKTVPVYSYFEGYVSEITVSEGTYVTTGTTLFKLSSLKSLRVEAQVFLPYIPDLKIGTQANISVPAAGNRPFIAKVLFLDPQVQTSSRYILARFEFTNPDENIKPGMLANVILQTERRRALTLPINAIIQDSKGSNVWIHNKDGVF